MPVGGNATSSTVNITLLNVSVGMRNLMQQITNLSMWVNGQGNGVQYLGQLGFSTAASAANPGGVSDAQLASSMIAYLNTLAGVYYGTVQQGGTGGTGATMFNFNQELSQLWSGQLYWIGENVFSCSVERGRVDEISRDEFDKLRRQVEIIDKQGTQGTRVRLRVHHDKVMFWSLLVIVVCFVAFAGLNAWFVLWDVGTAQHVWCHVLTTLNNAPAPTDTVGQARAYDLKLSQDFFELKRSLGC